MIAAVVVGACSGGPSPSGSTSAVASGSAPPVTVTIVARGIVFVPARLELPADVPFTLVFDNQDAGIPHGLSLSTRTSGVPPKKVFDAAIFPGPDGRTYDIPGIKARPYLFSCPVHPVMTVELDIR